MNKLLRFLKIRTRLVEQTKTFLISVYLPCDKFYNPLTVFLFMFKQ